ncbi:ROK family protein [Algoriphagus sediminis]|uniref:ROK family protein n=1 Tax=Algoriphagus sediminis TaxID=3057113 RepID=A0ABT7Y958_9BACT|nr:ROK family protein [Algoriphagus sediminis]MDN3202769.1 ROK family protein [Algoriphagus sediminis]
MKAAIGIDIGGTNIKGVLIDESGRILEKARAKTHSLSTDFWQENIRKVYSELKKKSHSNPTIGISAPGLANEKNTAIDFLPGRLPGLEGFDWSKFLGSPTYVLNDAHAALMAESKFGVAKGIKNFLLITLGTGVGGAIMIDGKLYQGLAQRAGHIGHSTIQSNQTQQSILGMPGSLEYAIGNYSVEERSHGKYKNTYALLEARKTDDYFAQWLWLDMIRNLSLSICSLINAFSPEAIVLAGGLTKAEDDLFHPLNQFIDTYEFRPNGKKTKIMKAKFRDYSGAIGAAAFTLNQMK